MTIVESCPHIANLRVPGRSTPIHKDECTQCFDDDQSPNGINVCLTCFNGACAKPGGHSEAHYRVTRHPLFANICKVARETPSANDSDSEPPNKITKLGINVPGGIQTGDSASHYRYHTTVHCLQCNVNIAIESDDQREMERLVNEQKKLLGEKIDLTSKSTVNQIIDYIQLASSASAASIDDSAWEEKPQPCKHTVTLHQSDNPQQIGAKGVARCQQCELTSNLWLCLTCGALGCGRAYVTGQGGNSHAVKHYEETRHPVVVKLGTISAEGTADLFCYQCDNAVIDPSLAQHMHLFGIDVAEQSVTEKTTAQLELDANLNHNWSLVLNEAGQESELIFGPGFAGLKNLGNSCYMASVIQTLFHLPEFKHRYFDQGQTHSQHCQQSLPADCFLCQMSKIGHGIYSGLYSVVPSDEELQQAKLERQRREAEKAAAKSGDKMEVDDTASEKKSKAIIKQLQPGVPPRMFKKLVAKGHAEFSSGKQQDALEFWHYFMTQIQQRERANQSDPTAIFNFKQQDRLECSECHGVRYSELNSSEIELSIPVKEPRTSDANNPKAEKIYDPVDFSDCLSAWAAKNEIKDYRCPRCQHATIAHSSVSFRTFPDYLLVVMRRFLFDSWVPTKLDAPVSVVSEVDLSSLRFTGRQSHEAELPTEAPTSAQTSQPVADPNIVMQLEAMGFTANAASRAALAVSNSDGEAAMNWLLGHLEDADINDPLRSASQPSLASSASRPPPELVAQLASMGFPEDRCEYALLQTSNSPDRAVEWLFSHIDEPLPSSLATNTDANASTVTSTAIDEAPARYRLFGAITHLGKSTSVGHYVCHLRNDDGSWVLFNDEKVSAVASNERGVGQGMDRAYLYVFKRQ